MHTSQNWAQVLKPHPKEGTGLETHLPQQQPSRPLHPRRPSSHAAGQQHLVNLRVRETASQGQSSLGWQVAEFPHVHVRGNEACKQCSPLPAWTACTALAHARARCIVHTMLLQGLAHHVDHVPEPKRNVPSDNARLIAQGILHEQLPALPAVCAWWRARIAHTFQHALLRRILMKEKVRDARQWAATRSLERKKRHLWGSGQHSTRSLERKDAAALQPRLPSCPLRGEVSYRPLLRRVISAWPWDDCTCV